MTEAGKRRAAYHTLGCKVNQYDTEAMRERFEAAGYETVPFEAEADVYLINTCTVTGTGDKKSLQMIRRCRRRNPAADIIVTGCLAQRDAEAVSLPGVLLVLGTQRRAAVVELYEQAAREGRRIVATESLKGAAFERLAVRSHAEHTRAVMKIQEGCNRYCAYCIIPYVRGPVRSCPPEAIREEAARLAAAGYREIVLTGIHLTSYGTDSREGWTLADAVEAAAGAPGLLRVRLGSLEPVVVTPDFTARVARIPELCPQFHLALQSGSDRILSAMRRRYTAGEFLAACRLLRDVFPDCVLTTDVMTGFPGETEEDFSETVRVSREARFGRMHVFPYSEREGTRAASLPDSVPQAVREARAARLIAVGKELARDVCQSFVGRTVSVLPEETDGDGFASGYTDGYLRARVEGACPGRLTRARVLRVSGETLICRAEETPGDTKKEAFK